MRHLNFSKYMVAGLMAASLLTTNTSCADYLDKEPDTELDIEMVFSNRDKVYQWLAFVYNTIHEPMSGCYKILRQAVDGAKGMDTVWNIVEDNIAYCENKLLNGQVDCNSSSRTTNVAHFLKLECMQQLVRDYREFANILAQTPPEENLQQTANKTEKKREEPPERKIKTGIRR